MKKLINIKILEKLRTNLSINGEMAKHSSLFLSLGLLLLAVKQVSEVSPWSLMPILGLISPPSVCFSTTLRIIHIAISFVVIIIVFWIWRKYRPEKFLRWPHRIVIYLVALVIFFLFLFILWLMPTITVGGYTILGVAFLAISAMFMIAVFCTYLASKLKDFLEAPWYWMIFLLVYSIGWSKGLSNVPSDSFAFPLADKLGFILFCVIIFVMFKAVMRLGKHSEKT